MQFAKLCHPFLGDSVSLSMQKYAKDFGFKLTSCQLI